MAGGFDFRDQMFGPWESAQGYLIEQLDRLYAQLNALPVAGLAPTVLAASPVSTSTIRLVWLSSDLATQTILYRDGARLVTIAAGVTQYLDTGLAAATLYTYFVRSVANGLESSGSVSAQATTLSTATVTWTGTTSGSVDLSVTSPLIFGVGSFALTLSRTMQVLLQGAAGGGAGGKSGAVGGGGGGGGAIHNGLSVPLLGGSLYTLTVGAGGPTNAGSTNGGNGGVTSVNGSTDGMLLQLAGGQGGQGNAGGNGGTPLVGGGGLSVTGGAGGKGNNTDAAGTASAAGAAASAGAGGGGGADEDTANGSGKAGGAGAAAGGTAGGAGGGGGGGGGAVFTGVAGSQGGGGGGSSANGAGTSGGTASGAGGTGLGTSGAGGDGALTLTYQS